MEIVGMAEASRRLRIHPCTLRRWCESGKVEPIRDSEGRRLFLGEQIDKLVKARKKATVEVAR